MFFLLDIDFSPMRPEFGLIFWTALIFGILLFLLAKYGLGPISRGLKARGDAIDDALKSAETARQEMANLTAKNEELLAEAREERTKMLRDAKDLKDQIIEDAKKRADDEYRKKVASAMEEIKNREMEMLINVKNQSGLMALGIAEKVIRKDLQGDADQEALVNKLIEEINI